MLGLVRRIAARLVAPLRTDENLENFTLAIPDSANTTYADAGLGWHERPPALLRCPECASAIYQHRASSSLDCAECWVERPAAEFPDLDLLYLRCPRCENRMRHGRRHPEAFDVPEWATCDVCRYHWEFGHSY